MPMDADINEFQSFASRHLPFGLLGANELSEVAASATPVQRAAGDAIYEIGDRLQGLYVIRSGAVEIISPEGERLSQLAIGDSFGERGLLRDGLAPTRAVAVDDCLLFLVPALKFRQLLDGVPAFKAFFERARPALAQDAIRGLASTPIADLMTRNPITIEAERPVKEAACIMRDCDISCLPVLSGHALAGMVTTGDLVDRVLAADLGADMPVGNAMTRDPFTLGPDALGFDALLAMTERSIGHLPIVENGKLVGILTTSNLIRRQAMSSVFLISDIKKGNTSDELAAAVAHVPRLLVQLVASGVYAHDTGRIITSVTDAVTSRLLELAESQLGPPPVHYLWLACGSQGRREQTGISDQDNCLFLDDSYVADQHGSYFEELARFVSDGLNACGYYYCPGDMMATNPRWRQPTAVWREYFRGWIAEPDPMAQMLSSVMFDLRPIAGETALFKGVQSETLKLASSNSIFQAHMISNSLKHTPPLSLFRGFALIRRGEHKDTIDLKLNGVVPIVDLARVYALEAAIEKVNTRERLALARATGKLSESGFRDLIDAYDLISNMRLRHQAEQIRSGRKPDNFMPPSALSDLERNHLREAFIVVKTLQSALAHRQSIGS
jgi:CBS domain-containing protein